ncbi:lasso RiPP family leader peptide-containing protein [Spirillospora sp. NPDC049652]
MSTTYEPPMFVVIGDLRDVTLGDRTWGFDRINQCAWLGC